MVDGKLLVGTRDDRPGLACYGYAIQTGLAEVKANRSGELLPLYKGFFDPMLPFSGPTALDALPSGELAIGTYGDGMYWGKVPGGNATTQTEHGVSLYQTGVA